MALFVLIHKEAQYNWLRFSVCFLSHWHRAVVIFDHLNSELPNFIWKPCLMPFCASRRLAGDYIFIVEEVPHETFVRNGNDLYHTCTIRFAFFESYSQSWFDVVFFLQFLYPLTCMCNKQSRNRSKVANAAFYYGIYGVIRHHVVVYNN